jgi:hypothetical protein
MVVVTAAAGAVCAALGNFGGPAIVEVIAPGKTIEN